jgi:hypothetical protein
MATMNKRYHHIAQDAVANRVYQAFERLQLAWYAVNARNSANANGVPQVDEAAIREVNAAEEEWLAVRDSASVSF